VTADLVIVGGGPAGAAAACLLARHGRRPLLLERETGAHDKVCGDFVSVEAQAALAALGLDPLLDLGLRLGEGTGTVLALPLVEAAARILREMATFDEAGIAGG
jgi:NaMN:DMB phosphoribosyltransferase